MDHCKWIDFFDHCQWGLPRLTQLCPPSPWIWKVRARGVSKKKDHFQRDGNRWCSLGFTLREVKYLYVPLAGILSFPACGHECKMPEQYRQFQPRFDHFGLWLWCSCQRFCAATLLLLYILLHIAKQYLKLWNADGRWTQIHLRSWPHRRGAWLAGSFIKSQSYEHPWFAGGRRCHQMTWT